LKDLGIDGIIMDLREKGRTAWTGLFCLRRGTIRCCSEHGNIIWNSANARNLPKKNLAPWSFSYL